MRLLLDTHAVLWWFLDHPMLSRRARAALGSTRNEVWISAVSVLEIETKSRLGRLTLPSQLASDWGPVIRDEGWLPLDISLEHARAAAWLPGAHRDPFDRLLAAQALAEDLTVVTCDEKLAQLGARALW